MLFVYHDGGRKAAGYRGMVGDCVVRAITIATELPYQKVYDDINILAQLEKSRVARSNAREGVYRKTYDAYLNQLGWSWTPTMKVGSGCRVHLRDDELPSGRLIVRLSRHLTAVLNSIIYDTHDPSREGTRCVYGYWEKK